MMKEASHGLIVCNISARTLEVAQYNPSSPNHPAVVPPQFADVKRVQKLVDCAVTVASELLSSLRQRLIPSLLFGRFPTSRNHNARTVKCFTFQRLESIGWHAWLM
jgi:hypothetical protein